MTHPYSRTYYSGSQFLCGPSKASLLSVRSGRPTPRSSIRLSANDGKPVENAPKLRVLVRLDRLSFDRHAFAVRRMPCISCLFRTSALTARSAISHRCPGRGGIYGATLSTGEESSARGEGVQAFLTTVASRCIRLTFSLMATKGLSGKGSKSSCALRRGVR